MCTAGTATRLRAWRSGVRIPAQARHSFLKVYRWVWDPPSSLFQEYVGALPPGVERPTRVVSWSSQYFAWVKIKGSVPQFPHTYSRPCAQWNTWISVGVWQLTCGPRVGLGIPNCQMPCKQFAFSEREAGVVLYARSEPCWRHCLDVHVGENLETFVRVLLMALDPIYFD